MKVAFATHDLHRVDGHFASARTFMMFEVDEARHTLIEAVQFEQLGDESGQHADDGDDRLSSKIAALDGVAILFVKAIGGPAAARVVKARVHPIKLADPEPIVQVIARLQDMMKSTPPPWLRKLMRPAPSFLDEEVP